MLGKEREKAPVNQSAGAFFLLFILRFFILKTYTKGAKDAQILF